MFVLGSNLDSTTYQMDGLGKVFFISMGLPLLKLKPRFSMVSASEGCCEKRNETMKDGYSVLCLAPRKWSINGNKNGKKY